MGWLSYDPELDLVYYGTGNPGPYNAEQRAGRQQVDLERAGAPAGRWLAGVGLPVHAARQLGLRRQRREPSWPTSSSTATGAQGPRCTSTRTALPTRSIAPPDEVLVAEPYVDVNWAESRIDLATGRPVLNADKQTGESRGMVQGHLPEP